MRDMWNFIKEKSLPWQQRKQVVNVVLLLTQRITVREDLRIDQLLLKLIQHESDDSVAKSYAFQPRHSSSIYRIRVISCLGLRILVKASEVRFYPPDDGSH